MRSRAGSEVRLLRARPARPAIESFLPGFSFQAHAIPNSETGIVLIAARTNPDDIP
jgi:hypothetical protein